MYFLLNTSAISVPLIFSFYHKTKYWATWKKLLPGLFIMDSIYIIWDIIFTQLGVWGFNEKYIIGYHIFNLPIEEWLFFICIPYASLFIHYSMLKIFPDWKFSVFNTKIIFYLIILTLLILTIINFGKLYTTCCFLSTIILLYWVSIKKMELLQTFFLSYLFILIPFFIINGILTGTFIIDQVVWYNNHHNMGIRLGTIPFEDIFYGFTLLLGIIIISDKKLISKKQ
ncbi:MAG: lycopene cyclase [Candidatus Marinimicrobia bacterium]|nr:lycopene cyclase [Candidatus Neomarinimicrobiota bacterium]